jgi:hypothetical protein
MSKLFRFPYFILFSVIAVNLTAFALVMQSGILIFNSLTAKVIAWTLAVCAWILVYVFRKR